MAKTYGVPYLSKKLDIQAASVRVQLRNKGVKKNAEGEYSWGSAAEADKIAEKLRAAAPAKKAAKSDKKASAKKAGKKAKKATPRATVKKKGNDEDRASA